MRFGLTLLVSALAALVVAQESPNAFEIPPEGYSLNAGEPYTFNWGNREGETVTLTLRTGASGDLDEGTVIQGM